MKTLMTSIGLAGLVALGGCASSDLRAEASSHCEANVSSRALASDCGARPATRSGLPYSRVQARNPAVDQALRNN